MSAETNAHPAVLRLVGLALVTGAAWSGLSIESGGGGSSLAAAVISAAVLAVGFLLAFREDPYVPRALYVGGGCITLASLAGVGVLAGFDGGPDEWVTLLVRGGSAFLAVAAAISAFSGVLYACSISEVLEVAERGAPGGTLLAQSTFSTVLAGTYAIPAGIATALLVGVRFSGWDSLTFGLVAGVSVSALASSASVAASWKLASGEMPMRAQAFLGSEEADVYAGISRAPADLAGVGLGVVALVVVGTSEAAEFVLALGIELLFTFVVAGVLTWGFLRLELVLLDRGIGRLSLIGLLALIGSALGIAAGTLAGEALLGDSSLGGIQNWTTLLAAIPGAVVVAVVLRRLGSVVGFVGAWCLLALHGHGWTDVIAGGVLGAFVGAPVTSLAQGVLAVASGSYVLRSVAFTLGIAGAILAGILYALPIALG